MTNEEAKATQCPLLVVGSGIGLAVLGPTLLHEAPDEIEGAMNELSRNSHCMGDRCGWWNPDSGRCGMAL